VSDQISKPTAKLSKAQIQRGIIALGGVFVSLFLAVIIPNDSARAVFIWLFIGFLVAYIWISKANKKALEAQGGDSALARMKTMLVIDHLAGLDDYQLQRAGTVMIVPEGIVFGISKTEQKLVVWDKIEHVEAGSEEQLRSRVTLSRVLLTGVFALALKKERKQKFYLSIETVDGVGLWKINSSGKDNRAMQEKAISFASKCNSQVKAAGKKSAPNKSVTSDDVIVQIEKLSELMEKKIISKSEFEAKKKELLGRL
jgi:hypothetical protein